MRVGILGGGQLGQMMALAGVPLGIRVTCLEATADCPAALVCPVVPGDVASAADVAAFAATVDVLTYETESTPVGPLRGLATPVLPGIASLAASQDRWAEKQLFAAAGVPCAPTVPAATEGELRAALTELPRLVKTRTGGYDGKGQVMVRAGSDIDAAVALLEQPGPGVVVEEVVTFDREISVIGARTGTGETSAWPVSHNVHRDGILRSSEPLPNALLQTEAERILGLLMQRLDHVGVLTVELFVVGADLVVNEIAPRVHNSGHWTIEGSETSQFEQHLRAITGLPLGSTASVGQVAMINLIGTEPGIEDVLAIPGAHLHSYGKADRPNRKLGHITVYAGQPGQLRTSVAAVQRLLIM